MDKVKIEFTASLPPIQSAILINGAGDGARIKLDIPQSEILQVLELQKLTNKIFSVIIEEKKEGEW